MKGAGLALAAGLGVLAFLPRPANACAGCRNPNMPVTRMEAAHLRAGELRIGAILGVTTLHVVHEAGCADLSDCSERPIQPLYLHDQRIWPGEIRLMGELGITQAFGVELQLPFRLVRTAVTYTTPEGRPYEPLDPDVHHRDETLAGFGDPWLLARASGAVGGFQISGRAGLALPLGKTEPNPFDLGDSGIRHQHIQFGSGTFDPVLALDISKSAGSLSWTGYLQGQASWYENRHGFRAGTRFSGGVQAGRRIWGTLAGALGLEGMREEAERWDGRIRQDGNLGRTELLAAGSLLKTFGAPADIPAYRGG
jgi:hypothetical protein